MENEYPSDHWSNVEAKRIFPYILLCSTEAAAVELIAAALRVAEGQGMITATKEAQQIVQKGLSL